MFTIFVKTILVGIEMGGPNSHSVSSFDLCAKLKFHFFRIDEKISWPVVMEIAVFVNQAADSVFRSDRTPAVIDALTGKGEVKAEIGIGMSFGVVGNFRKPWARHHDAGRVNEASVESLDSCRVHGVRYTNVVGMNNQQLGAAGIAQFFGKRLAAIVLRKRLNVQAQENQEQEEEPRRFHAVLKVHPVANEHNSAAGWGDLGI